MDSFAFDNVKAEKAKALQRFHSFRSIGFLFRVLEICVALLFICWLFTCLPFALRISGVFFRRLACVVSTPLFMFVLGNSIVFALLTTKSSIFSVSRTISGGEDEAEADIYDAFIISGENRVNSSDVDLTDEIVYDDKQMITTVTDSIPISISNSNSTVAFEDKSEKDTDYVTESTKDHPVKVYRRSKTEIATKQSPETVSKPSLKRSETEKCRKIVEYCEEIPLEDDYPENNMTNEEFQKTIEAFIAKQLIFRRRESLAVVVHNQI